MCKKNETFQNANARNVFAEDKEALSTTFLFGYTLNSSFILSSTGFCHLGKQAKLTADVTMLH